VIHDGLCFVNFGPGTESALFACDAKTGEVAWKVEPPSITTLTRVPPATFDPGQFDA
jgi:hypothetical protein